MYNLKPKNSTIYTPPELSQFLFKLLQDKVKVQYIVDPCCGKGSLLIPWKQAGYETLGIDNDKSLILDKEVDWPLDFFKLTKQTDLPSKVLILCNPPFNGMKPKLAPELWLDKILELFGKNIPLVFFAPLRLRLCSSSNNLRYQKWTKGIYPAIRSIISLPTTGVFKGVDLFSEILIFNLKGLAPHYFYQPNMN